jgi:hypothetical protein
MTSPTKAPASAPAHGVTQPAATLRLPVLPKVAFANVLSQMPPPVTVALPRMIPPQEADRRHRPSVGTDVDPMTQKMAQLAPPVATSTHMVAEAAAPEVRARMSLEDLVPQLVKQIAWSGDARRGTVRMELGGGELAGSTLTVSAENGRVAVKLEVPSGTDAKAWQERLEERLAARGISLDSVEVR